MAAGRWDLWETTAAAVRAGFPDRAEDLLAELESRLEPGPWSAEFRNRKTSAAWSRDRVFADVGRALQNADAALADATLRALERWLVDSAVVALQALLGARGIDPYWYDTAVAWAASALESGLDTESLRILAGLRSNETDDIDEYLRRTMRELAFESSSDAELLAAAFRFARDVVQGRIDPGTAERRLRDVASSTTNETLEIWREEYPDYGEPFTEPERFESDVFAAARALLGAP